MHSIGKNGLGAVLVAITWALLSLGATTSLAESPSTADTSEDQDAPHFLATLTVSGKVRYTPARSRECGTLSFQSQERTMVFTERPTRQALSMSTDDLVKSWTEGYGSVPPNAQLQLFNHTGASQALVLQLKSAPTWDSATHTVSFPNACLIEIADDTQKRKPVGEFEFGALFIDSAKAFDWNSCYPKDDNATTDADGVCLEQWGSYPASCQRAGGTGHTSTARGKRCKEVCKTTTCPNGCFKSYSASVSVSDLASAYNCK